MGKDLTMMCVFVVGVTDVLDRRSSNCQVKAN